MTETRTGKKIRTSCLEVNKKNARDVIMIVSSIIVDSLYKMVRMILSMVVF